MLLHPPESCSREAAFDVDVAAQTAKQGARAASSRRVKRYGFHCRGDKPGLGPAADPLLLRRQEKWAREGDPEDGGPLRGLPTPPVPKSGSVCNSLRSDSRRFLSDFGTSDVAPSHGDSRQKQLQLQRQRQRQRQLLRHAAARAPLRYGLRPTQGERRWWGTST